eukprot:gene12726-14031_t
MEDKKSTTDEWKDSGFESMSFSLEKLDLDDHESKNALSQADKDSGKEICDNGKVLSNINERTEIDGDTCSDDSDGVCLDQDDDGDSILHLAICNGNEILALKLIDIANWQSVNQPNILGQTPLFLAVCVQMTNVIRKLIDMGVDIETCDENGNNCIHIAAEFGLEASFKEIFTFTKHRDLDIFSTSLQMLLESKNFEGFTPLHLAARNKKAEMLHLVCMVGADVDAKDLKAGYTALHHLVEAGDVGLVNNFIQLCSPGVNAISYSGATPLHLAMSDNFGPISDILIVAGADTRRETCDELRWEYPVSSMILSQS